MSWSFDIYWRRWAVGIEWGPEYFLFIIGPLTAELASPNAHKVTIDIIP